MKYTGPKVKISRALGIPLTPKAAQVMEKKPQPPGQHGRTQTMRRKLSDYKRQLMEKQKLRAQYNIHERQMRNYYQKALREKGNTGENLLRLLEMRLDAVVLRGGLARTIYAARQYVSHQHLLVNGQRVDIASYGLKVGDVITVKPKSQKLDCFRDAVESAHPVPYLTLDKNTLTITVTALPTPGDVPIICDLPQVIEFYSR
ncbi:MAG: 30S ribosomal protein S4 [Caldilineaceae bacterium]|nr:30S ribosomal protein S4 [Caldilineaceae bacterium]